VGSGGTPTAPPTIKGIKSPSSHTHGDGPADGFVTVFDIQLVECLIEVDLLLAVFEELSEF
jgi:hypothetical protein